MLTSARNFLKRIFICSILALYLLVACAAPVVSPKDIPLDCNEFYSTYISSRGISQATWNNLETLVFLETAYLTDGKDNRARRRVATAVTRVVFNRVDSPRFNPQNDGLDRDIREIIFAPGEFSPVLKHPDLFTGACINNAPFMYDDKGRPLTYRLERLRELRYAMLLAFSQDPTGGALYFKVPEKSEKWPCETGKCECNEIDLGGSTKFYKDPFCIEASVHEYGNVKPSDLRLELCHVVKHGDTPADVATKISRRKGENIHYYDLWILPPEASKLQKLGDLYKNRKQISLYWKTGTKVFCPVRN